MLYPDLQKYLADLDVRIKHVGNNNWIACHCPFAPYVGHPNGTDREASCFVKIEANGVSGYHCFTCKQKGRLSGMARALAHFRQEDYTALALEIELNEATGGVGDYDSKLDYRIEEPEPLPKATFLDIYPTAEEIVEAQEYLRKRGVTPETSLKLQLHYDEEEWRIIFPVLDFQQNLFGFTGRTILEGPQIEWVNEDRKRRGRWVEYSRHKDYGGLNKELFLLGEHTVTRNKPIIIVEGSFALAHFHSIGVTSFANVVATMGSAVSRYQKDILVDYALPVYMFYDNDEAGETGIYGERRRDGDGRKGGGAVDKLKSHVPVMIPLYPPGKDDPDDLTLADVSEMFETAEIAS